MLTVFINKFGLFIFLEKEVLVEQNDNNRREKNV